ncbi:EFR1 family ferrodoxin [Peptacetobacter sp.]|uniref:EFR1 family ferrodoxin n=1 Tax=Peptacetobacter sp. TaxID=2991975 RepID=UPI002626570A|nr:EFR1 family ferrodoxin [Peptacetobacter sp.]
MLYTIYFSPTGRTEKIAKTISSMWKNVEYVDISRMDINYDDLIISKEDIVMIVVPSFGGRIPNIAAERLSKIEGNGAKSIAVVVYGNREYDDTLIELYDLLKEDGFIVGAMISAVAEHSIIRSIASNRPDEADIKELKSFSEKIKNKFENEDINKNLLPKGNRPYKDFKGSSLKPIANERCNECGLCVEKCPVGAISTDDMKNVDKNICISCMRCIEVCPNKARYIDYSMKEELEKRLKPLCSERKNNELIL